MNPLKLDKSYRSEIDVFLMQLHKDLPLSASQQKEIEKAKRIAKLRDTIQSSDTEQNN